MNTVSAQTASERLDALIDEVVASGEPVLITGVDCKTVLISEELWRGIQETIDLVSIPGMHASIRDGMGTAHHELSSEPLWCAATGCPLRQLGIAPGLPVQRR